MSGRAGAAAARRPVGPPLTLAALLWLTESARSAFLLSYLPAYAQELGLSAAAAGAAISVHYLADAVMKLAAGPLLDRERGRERGRLFLLLTLLLGLIGLGVAYFAQSAVGLVAGAALLGIGVSPIWLLCLSRVQGEGRGLQMGAIYTLWLTALGGGPIAVNFALDRGFAFAFWLMVAFWIAGWLAAALRQPDEARAAAPAPPPKLQWDELRVKLRRIGPLVPGMMLQTAAAGLLLPVLPRLANAHLGLSYSEYSAVLLAGGACTALLLLPMGRLSDRWGERRLLVLGFVALGLCLLALLRVRGLAGALPVAAALGASYAAVLPSWNALQSTFVPAEQRAAGWGVLSGIEGVGVLIGPVAGGWIAASHGDPAALAVSAGLLLAIAGLYLVLPLQAAEPAAAGGRDGGPNLTS